MDVSVDHADRHPEVVLGEDDLLVKRSCRVRRQLDHPELRMQRRGVLGPVERRVALATSRELLHPLEGLLVDDERQIESLGDGLVRDVIVAGTPIRPNTPLHAIKAGLMNRALEALCSP